MIFKILNNNSISIDMSLFLERQMEINKRFPNPNRESGKLVNIFDNMSGQIMEEIFEVKESLNLDIINNNYQSKESLEEFIDYFMYTGSLLCEMFINFNIDYKEWLKEYKLEKLIINDTWIMNHTIGNENNKINIGYDFIPAIRRKIYDRKYHKPTPKKPNNYENELLIYTIFYMYLPKEGIKGIDYGVRNKYRLPNYIENLNNHLQSVFFCYDDGRMKTDDVRIKTIPERIKLLNEIINKKENFITNL